MPLIRSGAINGFESLVSKLGRNPITMLKKHDLSHAQLTNPNTYISYSSVASLLEDAAQQCEEPLLGLLLSQRHSPTIIGELYFSLPQWTTLREVLLGLDKYLYLHASGAHLTQVPQGNNVLIEVTIQTGGSESIDQLMQMSVGQLNIFISETLGLKQPNFLLQLTQPAPTTPNNQTLQNMLQRVRFDAPKNGALIPAEWLNRRPQFDEASMRRHFQNYLQTLQQRYPGNLIDQVKSIIVQLLPTGECSLKGVATTLQMHPRALQKALKEDCISYHELLQQTRQNIATDYLRRHSLSISELALNLGFAEASVFSRSFRRWTGMSPKCWQQKYDKEKSLSASPH